MKNKPYLYKRLIAYAIDFLVVSLFCSMISAILWNNNSNTVTINDLLKLTQQKSSGEMTQEEYEKEYNESYYLFTIENFNTTALTCGMSLVYYVIVCYFCHGITLGKYLMKLKIVRLKGHLNMSNLLIRSLLVNMILASLMSTVLVTVLSKEDFLLVYPKISMVLTMLMVLSLIFMLCRDDGRGIHDLIAGTKIIHTSKNIPCEEEKIHDVKIIKEKKEESGI